MVARGSVQVIGCLPGAVFDAGQNSGDNFAHLAAAGLHYVGSVPASDCPDLTSLPASVRVRVNQARFGDLNLARKLRLGP